MSGDQSEQVLYVVGCAAPPVRDLGTLITLLQAEGWTVCVLLTPTAAEWVDTAALAEQTGYPVRSHPRSPDDGRSLPKADAILVVPATFNTINKWAGGISDNVALGTLNEAIGLKLPVTVVPYAKAALAAHPAFGDSLRKLAGWGVRVLENELVRPAQNKEKWKWTSLRNAQLK
ncbi:flavoprotein [Actinokineospora spheciospongiae]|uniref:flavoprotein n=1 Tax=Actinokineospora spheciospongiae TaxID=909613 RepID=UPI000D866220|nr:flavoprotein [Actinokineospora spheciospongiae]PWW53663.1 flavoprotein [Actinokineospora spheciospongiae]